MRADPFCYEQGKEAARRDIANGRFKLVHHEDFSVWQIYWKAILEHRYGVTVLLTGAPDLLKQREYDCGYNDVAESAICARFGRLVLLRTQAEAKRMLARRDQPLGGPSETNGKPEMEARLNEYGWARCPNCGTGFRIARRSLRDGNVHARCGQALRFVLPR
jgi:hypothetical protein